MNEAEMVGGQDDPFITMKKNKKFIKFKDYIIKMPNSQGLSNPKNIQNLIGLGQNISSDIEDNEMPPARNIGGM